MKKDLQICDSLTVAYEAQKKTLLTLANRNIYLFNSIEDINKKSEFWKTQIKKQEDEIVKLQKRKKNRLIWFGAGVFAGLVTGVVISN